MPEPDERPVARLSEDAWRVWLRSDGYRIADPGSLAELARTHRIVVRVPVPRQRWPEPMIG